MKTYRVYFNDGNQKLYSGNNIGDVVLFIAYNIPDGYKIDDVYKIEEVEA